MRCEPCTPGSGVAPVARADGECAELWSTRVRHFLGAQRELDACCALCHHEMLYQQENGPREVQRPAWGPHDEVSLEKSPRVGAGRTDACPCVRQPALLDSSSPRRPRAPVWSAPCTRCWPPRGPPSVSVRKATSGPRRTCCRCLALVSLAVVREGGWGRGGGTGTWPAARRVQGTRG